VTGAAKKSPRKTAQKAGTKAVPSRTARKPAQKKSVQKTPTAGRKTDMSGTKTGAQTSAPLNQKSKKATVSKTVTKTSKTTGTPKATRTIRAKVAAAPEAKPSTPLGFVSFVGSGPGDPELLTVRAADLLRAAEIVVTEVPEHATLVAALAPGAEVVDGGFGTDGQPLTHAGRAKVVVKQAKTGRRVVRLMAGDPFVYASGPEEAQACVKAGVAFEIVPGVSSVTAVPAYAGVPLTDKKHREVAVVNCSEARIDWSAYADDRTLVLLSAVGAIGDVAKALVDAGRAPETPVAMTRVGTTTEQETVVSTLERIAADARAARMSPPAVTVVGDVVDLRTTLSWFETKPLFGWRVLVPRTKEQAGSLSARLRGFGAVPEEVPTISVEPPRNPQQMDKAIRGLVEGRYEWIAFTSVNAVRAVREKFEEYGLDARAFSGLKIAAVGEKTAAAIEAWGLRADLVPSGEQSARGLLEDWPPYDDVLDPINRVFLPRADIATETLVAGLLELGWEVDDVTAYRTVRATPPPAPTREAIKTGKFDAVVFTSSSTVRNLVGIAGKPHASTIIAVIGPATAKTAEEHGLRVDVLASEPSVEVLVDALADFGSARRASMIEAGQPVTRPSERRPSARRKAT
jgi:uroporphyrinogen III methyltransferase/synthase